MTQSKTADIGTALLVVVCAVMGFGVGMAFGEKQRQELTETLKPKTPEERAREEYALETRYNAFEIRYIAEKMRLTEPRRRRECEAEAKQSLLSEVAFRKNDEGELECMHRSRCASDGKHCGEWVRR